MAATTQEPEVIPGQQDIEGGEHTPPAPLEDLRVDGTTQLDFFNAGGKRPDSASITLAGGKVGLIDGRAFKKGDVIRFEGTAVVTAVTQQDKTDSKTGIVVSAEQRHTARITDLVVST